jgi:hypothetical protein
MIFLAAEADSTSFSDGLTLVEDLLITCCAT